MDELDELDESFFQIQKMGIFLKQIDDVEAAILSRTNILQSKRFINIISSLYPKLPKNGKKRVLSSLFTMLHEVYPAIRLKVLEAFASTVPVFPNLLFSALSKGNTNASGCVGLLKEINTFYMNSILETLFYLPIFRQIVYSITAHQKDSVITALQHLFTMLQLSSHPVSTEQFTKTFWNPLNINQKQDFGMFFKKLLSNFEQSFIQQKSENLFCSEISHSTYNTGNSSQNTEQFYSLSLPIKNLTSLEDAIFHFIQEKDAQYFINEPLNDDENPLSRTHFSNLPLILVINLRRYESSNNDINDSTTNSNMNINANHNVNNNIINNSNTNVNSSNKANNSNLSNLIKIQAHIHIPDELDLSPFTILNFQNSETIQDSVNQGLKYRIHSVIVDVGEVFGSQNIAYIKEDLNKKEWLYFNDSIVEKVNDSTAKSAFKNAYCLCYVREDEIKQVMKPVEKTSIPSRLITYFESTQKLNQSTEKFHPETGTIALCLEDASPEIRAAAIRAIAFSLNADHSTHASELMKTLAQMLNDGSPLVRRSAIVALRQASTLFSHLVHLEDPQLRMVLPMIEDLSPNDREQALLFFTRFQAINYDQTEIVCHQLDNSALRFYFTDLDKFIQTAKLFGQNNSTFIKFIHKSSNSFENKIKVLDPQSIVRVVYTVSAAMVGNFPISPNFRLAAYRLAPLFADLQNNTYSSTTFSKNPFQNSSNVLDEFLSSQNSNSQQVIDYHTFTLINLPLSENPSSEQISQMQQSEMERFSDNRDKLPPAIILKDLEEKIGNSPQKAKLIMAEDPNLEVACQYLMGQIPKALCKIEYAFPKSKISYFKNFVRVFRYKAQITEPLQNTRYNCYTYSQNQNSFLAVEGWIRPIPDYQTKLYLELPNGDFIEAELEINDDGTWKVWPSLLLSEYQPYCRLKLNLFIDIIDKKKRMFIMDDMIELWFHIS